MSDESLLYGAPPPEEPPPPPTYPVRFDIDAPPEVSRLSTAFRIILLIPLAIAVSIIGTGGWFTPYLTVGFGLSGGLVLFHWLTVLVRGRPVGWVFDVLVAMQRFILRANTYFMLVTDKYPPFEGEWKVSYDVDRPERLQRKLLFIWKTLASIPHFFVLFILWFAVAVCVVIAWFAILFTGRYPLGLRGFVIGWLRWSARVNAYWMSLRDEFPPFSMSEETGPATRTAHVVSGIGGLVAIAGIAVGIAAAVVASSSTDRTQVSYEELIDGSGSETLQANDIEITLLGAIDPYEFEDGLLTAGADERYVAFGVDLFNLSDANQVVGRLDFKLEDDEGNEHRPLLVSFGDSLGPVEFEDDENIVLVVIFAIDEDAEAEEFRFEPEFLQKAVFEFTR